MAGRKKGLTQLELNIEVDHPKQTIDDRYLKKTKRVRSLKAKRNKVKKN